MIEDLFNRAYLLNNTNILTFVEKNPEAKLLDLGCDDGTFTKKMAEQIGTTYVWGIDLVGRRLQLAKKRGVKTKKLDLNRKFSFPSRSFDVITANQVIEHIADVDLFITEICRLLKPDGYMILSTENGSSWHNIFASLMGWQIFSLTNFSSMAPSVGNPLSIHRKDKKKRMNNYSSEYTWNHVRIFNFYGLKEYLDRMGFVVECMSGAGYYPFPSFFGNIDKVHAHFISFKCRKR